MFEYENKYIAQGYKLIAGMDEAGRGPLAGPVTACCCIMDMTNIIVGINDSKKLSEKKRDMLYDQIVNNAICYAIVDIDMQEIDKINILNATKLAMKQAVMSLEIKPEVVLIDAVNIDLDIPNLPLIGGDAISYSIACASILAKVHRDRLMQKYALEYPQYGLEKHKGYGTKYHIEMLKEHGACPLHRKTFIKKFC